MILGIRTDKPEAELYLGNNDGSIIEHFCWSAHKRLAESIHKEIASLLARHRLGIGNVTKLAVYKGPGSFTGLRIGISTANAFAYGLNIPIVGAEGEAWLEACLSSTELDQKIILPVYGQEPHITQAKK